MRQIKYLCDRCEQEIELFDDTVVVNLESENSFNTKWLPMNHTRFELCPDCADKILRFIQNGEGAENG